MSYHTIFSRPLTKEEFEIMKVNAPFEMENIMQSIINNSLNESDVFWEKKVYELLMKSYIQDIPCVYGYYWYQLGWGSGDIYADIHNIRGYKANELFIDVDEYFDTFTVNTFHKHVIHNKKELRKYLKAKYFSLTPEQHNKIDKFFKEYPKGVITFV